MKITLRPTGRGNWRPLVLTVNHFPRQQGRLFRKDDEDRELVRIGDTWTIDGREFRIARVKA